MDDGDSLHLGHDLWSLRPTLHNGPGWRVPLWVQGCSIRCTTVCLNPHFLSGDGGFHHRVEDIAARLRDLVDRAWIDIEGVTVLGGEPTDQAAAVGRFFAAARDVGLSTMLYSGATLEQLRARGSADIDALLALTDILVDGPFRAREFDKELIWRGSRNQRILPLTSRYSEADIERALAAQGRSFSALFLPDGRVSVSGLQTRSGAGRIERQIAAGPLISRAG